MVRPGGTRKGPMKMKKATARRRVASYSSKRKATTQPRKRLKKEEFDRRGYEPYVYKGSRRARSETSDDTAATDGAESWDVVSEDSYDTESDDGKNSNNKGKGKMSDSKHSNSRSGSQKRPNVGDVKAANRSDGSESLDQTPHDKEQTGESKREAQTAAQEQGEDGDEVYESDDSYSYSTS